jgi:hypothetical protein
VQSDVTSRRHRDEYQSVRDRTVEHRPGPPEVTMSCDGKWTPR